MKDALERKADIAAVNECLESKANKASVASALHRKVCRRGADSVLGFTFS